jgi:hypothetical protein
MAGATEGVRRHHQPRRHTARIGSRINVPGYRDADTPRHPRDQRRRPRTSYIIWLRHGHPDAYVRFLTQAGVIDVAVHHS